jgi:uncharacterized protein YacL
MAGRAVRWALAALGAAGGFYVAVAWLGVLSQSYPLPLEPLQAGGVAAAGIVVGAAFGHQVGPALLRGARFLVRRVEHRARRVPTVDLLAGLSGALVGLILALLLGPVLGRFDLGLRALITVALAYGGAAAFLARREDWHRLWTGRVGPDAAGASGPAEPPAKIVDTSAIIDGRVVDLYGTGFLEGALVVASGVLDELRHMADSGDELRRQRGRYGLEVLASLQKQGAPVLFETRDPAPEAEVDTKLVVLAREMGGQVVTTDFNLNKVAELQGVPVLNVHALASAMRPRVLTGEDIEVRVVGAGKQPGQGVGYLADGTMVVVEGGRHLMQSDVTVTVTNVIQNQQGRMIFGKPKMRREDDRDGRPQ